MGYSADVVRRARQRLASAKADRESENLEHLQIAYARVPRIKEIDLLLRRSMTLAAQAVFTEGGDPQLAMEQVKQSNLALQQERALLAQEYFDEGFLDDSPICHICGGSGYVGTQMCECLLELCRQEQKKDIALLTFSDERFENFRLEFYPAEVDPHMGISPRKLMQKNLEVCRRFAFHFGTGSGNLLFSGGTGLGKTFLSACIARVVADRGFSVCYETATHLFDKLERNRFDPDGESRAQVAQLTNCDLLIIDDLGTELGGQFVTAALYSLINDRLLAGRSMIISTNLNLDEIGNRYSCAIMSRLQGSFDRRIFLGEDIRMKKARGY